MSEEMDAFERWWNDEGSGKPPAEGQDHEEHVREMCRIAWENGAYVAKSTPHQLQNNQQ